MDKICNKCGASDFNKRGHCKPCTRAYGRAWRRANLDKVRAYEAASRKKISPEKQREHYNTWAKSNPAKLLFKTNKAHARRGGYAPISLADCERAVANKPDLCEACHERPASHADHDHRTGAFRGWLCKGCNLAEGYLGQPSRAVGLSEYMLKFAVKP